MLQSGTTLEPEQLCWRWKGSVRMNLARQWKFHKWPVPLWIPALSCIQHWKKVCRCSNQPSLQTVILPSSEESDTASKATIEIDYGELTAESRRPKRRGNHQKAVCLNAPSWDSWLVFLNSRSLFLVCPLPCSPRFAQAGLPSTLPSLAPSPPSQCKKEHRVCRSLRVVSKMTVADFFLQQHSNTIAYTLCIRIPHKAQ